MRAEGGIYYPRIMGTLSCAHPCTCQTGYSDTFLRSSGTADGRSQILKHGGEIGVGGRIAGAGNAQEGFRKGKEEREAEEITAYLKARCLLMKKRENLVKR